MYIQKNKVSTEAFVHARGGYFGGLMDVYHYLVSYRGHLASGPDLGACIERCYEAVNPKTGCAWEAAANQAL